MNWKIKALLHWIMSYLPKGNDLLYLFQRYIIKSVPRKTCIKEILDIARQHLNSFKNHSKLDFKKSTFFEFGTGKDLIIPLCLYSFGLEHQIAVDIDFLLRKNLINNFIDKFSIFKLNYIKHKPDKKLTKNIVKELKEYYGIEYFAPYNFNKSYFKENSIDCITSTATMEHIPIKDIKIILSECNRMIKKDGIMSVMIDYQDHYYYNDPHISRYNFLKYSNKRWSFFNPSQHYQNRLRHKDYIELFQEAGFVILSEDIREGTSEDLKILEQLSISKNFNKYSYRDLAIHSAFIVAKKNRLKTNSDYENRHKFTSV